MERRKAQFFTFAFSSFNFAPLREMVFAREAGSAVFN